MNRALYFALAMLAANIVFAAGCAGGGPFGFGGNRLASQSYGRGGNALASAGVGQKPPRPTAGQAIYSAFQRSSQKLAAALTIKPRVIPANDPTALSNTPDKVNADVFNQAAQLYENKGDPAAAIGQYEKALESEPNNLKAMLGIARLYDRQEDFSSATAMYLRALEAHPNHAIVLNDLGLCYARQRNLDSSVEALRGAVEADPESQLYRNNLATVLIERGQYDEALEHFAAAHGPAGAHFNLGYLLAQKGEQELAAFNLQRALEHDPNLEAAQQLLAQLNSADTAAAYQAQNPSAADNPETSVPNPTVAPEGTEPNSPSGGEYPSVRLPDMNSRFRIGQAQAPPQPNQSANNYGYFAEPRHLPPVE